MVTLTFPGTEVLELVDHAKAARKHSTGDFGPAKPGPGLIFVKDSGIYLISNGEPSLAPKEGGKGNRVVYAQGYEPAKMIEDAGGDWNEQYAKIEDAAGGDDFAEFMSAKFFDALRPGDTVKIRLGKHYADVEIHHAPPSQRDRKKK